MILRMPRTGGKVNLHSGIVSRCGRQSLVSALLVRRMPRRRDTSPIPSRLLIGIMILLFLEVLRSLEYLTGTAMNSASRRNQSWLSRWFCQCATKYGEALATYKSSSTKVSEVNSSLATSWLSRDLAEDACDRTLGCEEADPAQENVRYILCDRVLSRRHYRKIARDLGDRYDFGRSPWPDS